MARDDGFQIADVAVGLLDDDKVRKLWRRTDDEAAMCAAIVTHLSVLLASWAAGRRVQVEEATPLWLTVHPETVEHLTAVGLLDRQRRIPAHAWRGWFGPAAARREARQEAGRKGGLASRKPPVSNATATLYPTGRQAGPSSPSIPTVKRARRRNGAGPSSLRDVLSGTPFGDEHGLGRSS